VSVLLTYTRGNSAAEVSFDAVVTEVHSMTAQVTSHPVEQGSNVSDHVYNEPRRITLDALVTNTPLATPKTHARGARAEVRSVDLSGSAARGRTFNRSALAASGRSMSASLLQWDGEMDRPRDVYHDLVRAMTEKSVFTVDTEIEQYKDMVITSMSTPRDAGSGKQTDNGVRVDRLSFQIEMVQVRIASSRDGKVTRTPKQDTPKAKQNRGPRAKKEATTEEGSLWYQSGIGLPGS
jgi:hypothetical protein